MLVSHDRALLRAVCDEFWLVARGGVTPFDGDLDDYQRYLLDEARRLREAAAVASNTSVSIAEESACTRASGQKGSESGLNPAEQRRLEAQRRQQLAEKTRPHKRALAQAEQAMHALTQERDALEARLATPLEPAAIAETGRRLKAVADELTTLEDQWLHLSAQIEALEQAAANPSQP